MTKTVHGIVHGRMIEVTDELGIADGQEVEIQIQPVSGKRTWGEGILRSAGAMAPFWTEEDDRILEEIRQNRSRTSHREIPE